MQVQVVRIIKQQPGVLAVRLSCSSCANISVTPDSPRRLACQFLSEAALAVLVVSEVLRIS